MCDRCGDRETLVGQNLAAVLHGKGDLRIEKIPIPSPKDDEVLVRMYAVGICGTDKHFFANGRIGDYTVNKPLILGHEGSGIVAKVGKDVKCLKEGDPVAIEPGVPCRKCELCTSGKYNLCPKMHFCAHPPDDGLLREYFCVPGDFCFKLPENISIEEGALLEPLAVAIQACRKVDVGLGSHVLICGAGPIGLLHMLVAKNMGATKLIVADLNEQRLAKAKELGASCVIKVNQDFDPKEVADNIQDLCGDCLPDITLECTGQEQCIELAVLATGAGGSIALVGLGPHCVQVPVLEAIMRELTIKGVWRYSNCFPAAIELVKYGAIDLKPLITHTFELAHAQEAFEFAHKGDPDAIKVLIHCH